MEALSSQNLVKEYVGTAGVVRAVDNVTLAVPKGSLFGFLGPNGAGKTSFMKMVHAVLPPTSGQLTVLGLDVARDARALKARLGVAPQENNLDPDFDVEKNLTVYARYFDLPRPEARRRAEELLAFVGLQEKARARIDDLSGGMKRRLILARALINDPELVVLDEPTTGLDPQARHLVWEKIRSLRRQGRTTLLTTHYMEEAEQLCDDLVIFDQGRIIQRGRPRELVQTHASKEVLELVFDHAAKDHEAALRRLPGMDGGRIEFVGERALLYVRRAEDALVEAKAKLPIRESLVRRGTLEDVFLQLTGRALRE